jgi:hypothetical protein
MIRSTEQQLSEEDAQLIEANDLGSPFAIFKINPMYISFMYFLFFLLVIFFLIFASAGLIFLTGSYWQRDQTDYLLLAMGVLLTATSFLGAIVVLRVELPEARKRRIIVCEEGLLEVKETLRGRKTRMLYWRDVRRIEKQFGLYYIVLRGREMFPLDLLIGNVKELIALIKQRSPYYR